MRDSREWTKREEFWALLTTVMAGTGIGVLPMINHMHGLAITISFVCAWGAMSWICHRSYQKASQWRDM